MRGVSRPEPVLRAVRGEDKSEAEAFAAVLEEAGVVLDNCEAEVEADEAVEGREFELAV